MPVPPGELTPRELCDEIARWARDQGYIYEERPRATEYRKVIVRDPAGGYTNTSVPKAHPRRRLRPDQVRYAVQQINNNWRG